MPIIQIIEDTKEMRTNLSDLSKILWLAQEHRHALWGNHAPQSLEMSNIFNPIALFGVIDESMQYALSDFWRTKA